MGRKGFAQPWLSLAFLSGVPKVKIPTEMLVLAVRGIETARFTESRS